jgi:NSS family neurotransmitter:Na+ symporter
MAILDSIDLVATNYMLPVGGLFIALFAGWFLKDTVKRQLLDLAGSQRFYRVWRVLIRYFTPVAVALLILFMVDKHIGVLESLLGGQK